MDEKWKREPHYFEYRFEGIDCRGVRQRKQGYWMGYIVLEPSHPWFYAAAEELADIDVHGKVQWTGPNPFLVDALDNTWWIGFNCGHEFDLQPFEWEKDPSEKMFRGHVYRDMEFLIEELKKLAERAALVRDYANSST